MRKDIVYYYNVLDKRYRSKSDKRWPTLKAAINLFVQRTARGLNPVIVETGCARLEDDWGAGLSTIIFGNLCKELRDTSHLFTVDISQENMETCIRLTRPYANHISYTVMDSIEYLRNWPTEIGLLYLDSYDYPYVELLNKYGGKEDIDKAISTLESLPESEIVKKHGDIITPSQQHCLEEIVEAMPHLSDESIVLIDDNSLPGGGKPRLAKQYLAELGWTCVLDMNQTLWIR